MYSDLFIILQQTYHNLIDINALKSVKSTICLMSLLLYFSYRQSPQFISLLYRSSRVKYSMMLTRSLENTTPSIIRSV